MGMYLFPENQLRRDIMRINRYRRIIYLHIIYLQVIYLHIIHHCLCCSFTCCPFGPGVAAGAGEAIRDAGERHHLPGVFTLKDAAVRMVEDDESHPTNGCCGIVMLNSD